MNSNIFNYENTEIKNNQMGGKQVRKVFINKGRGYKSITRYLNGKKVGTIKKTIPKSHINLIKRGIFIPGLFNDCKKCKYTRKNKK
jgi:hypothetical protein